MTQSKGAVQHSSPSGGYWAGLLLPLILIWTGGLRDAEAQVAPRTAATTPAPIAAGQSLRHANGRDVLEGDVRVSRARYRMAVPLRGGSPQEVLAAEMGWSAADLSVVRIDQIGLSRHFLYQQTHRGVPVLNGLIRVNTNAQDEVTMVISRYSTQVTVPSVTPAFPAGAARAAARAALTGSAASSEAKLVILPGKPARLAWQVVVWPVATPSEFEVLIDAQTGDVLMVWDATTRRRHDGQAERPEFRTPGNLTPAPGASASGNSPSATTSARPDAPGLESTSARPDAPGLESTSARLDAVGLVFNPDPLATSGSDYTPPFVDDGDATNPSLDAQRQSVTLPGVTRGTDGLVRLEGAYVRITGQNSGGVNVYTPPAEPTPAFQYNRSESGFEAVNVYYHIDANQRYVQSLGFDDLQSQSPLPINPQGTTGDDSGWLASQRYLFFGTGGVDDGEDVAVVLHEYAHALLEAGAPGLRGTLEGQALHEGWADYWAMSYQRELMESGSLARDDWEEVFRWDSGIGAVWAGRRLDFAGTYPQATCSDNGSASGCSVHNDGRFWGTTMMEIYSDLGREVTDRLSLLSHRYLAPGVTFADAAEALIQADIDHYAGDHVEVLMGRLGPRGLVDPAGFGPIITHEALTATEDLGGTRPVAVRARGIAGQVAMVTMHWRHDNGAFAETVLQSAGSDMFEGALPLPEASGQVQYFLRARDTEGQETLLPREAPSTTFSFAVGPDNDPPVIIHPPIGTISLLEWPPDVAAVITDNLGVSAASVDYRMVVPGEPDRLGAFSLTSAGDNWTGAFDVPVSLVAIGTQVTYTIRAVDASQAENEAHAGPHSFSISGSGVLRAFDPSDTDSGVILTGDFSTGAPAFGTNVAHSGNRVWATNPGGPYASGTGVSTIELPPTNLTGSGTPSLVFWHWYDTEHDGRADPSGNAGSVLWDGGIVMISGDGGQTWTVGEPDTGYTGTIIDGPDNPLARMPAFGGFSHGWRRAVMPLPAERDVRIRFDFGVDATNSEVAEAFAGWMIDDVQITNALPDGSGLPTLTTEPTAVRTAAAGAPLPLLQVVAVDDVGVSDAFIEWALSGTGGDASGLVRMTQSSESLSEFGARILTSRPTEPGDQVVWRILLRDVDGNERLIPAAGTAGYVINVRLASAVNLLPGASAGPGWSQTMTLWTGTGAGLGGLVFPPVTMAANLAEASLVVGHDYSFAIGSGGQLEVSRDDGKSWALAEPVGGYPGSLDGEGAFIGEAARRTDRVDLSLLGGEVIRIRLVPAGGRSANRWTVRYAEVSQETSHARFELPSDIVLHANFPNPFSETTNVSYTLPEALPVFLTVHDMLGRRVLTLDAGIQEAGNHTTTLDASGLAAGVYLLRLDTGSNVLFELITVAR